MEDLDINNYDLKDLLLLFKLPSNYDKRDLLSVKKLLAKYHPDKVASSELPPKYYFFLKEAYDILNSLLQRSATTTTTTTHFSDDEFSTESLEQYFRNEKIGNFNEWFNKHFEQVKGADHSNGYEDWLRDNTDNKKSAKTKGGTISQSLINGFYLDGNEDKDYDSEMFTSSLQYQDLYNAHNTPLIKPDDSFTHQQFKSAVEMKLFRDKQDITPLTKEESLNQLNQTETFQREQALLRKYNLLKEEKHFLQRRNDFLNSLK